MVESEETSIVTQRLSKQLSTGKVMQATIEELLGTVFSSLSVQSGYEEAFS
jgi:hypothetical protein